MNSEARSDLRSDLPNTGKNSASQEIHTGLFVLSRFEQLILISSVSWSYFLHESLQRVFVVVFIVTVVALSSQVSRLMVILKSIV